MSVPVYIYVKQSPGFYMKGDADANKKTIDMRDGQAGASAGKV